MTTSIDDPLLQSTTAGREFAKVLASHRLLARQWLMQEIGEAEAGGDQARAQSLTELREAYELTQG